MSESERTDVGSDVNSDAKSQIDGEMVGEVETGPNRFDLPIQADIRVAAEIHSRCEAALEAAGDVQVDCGAVESVDAAVLQCIGSLAKSLRESSRRLELVDRSEPFDRAVALLGFDDLLVGR